MREYKFRGKRKDNGEWVYGNLVRYFNNPAIQDYSQTNGEIFWVYPETVGQYTGIKDRNGKKIYEGDLLDISDRVFPQEVHMDEGCYGTEEFALYELVRNRERTFEVIGIIYDNPELWGANV